MKPPFTVKEIKAAHQKVASGADFPAYIQALKQLGVTAFETFVVDSHTVYVGRDGYQTQSAPMYTPLVISEEADPETFVHYLGIHQQGQTDYLTFCRHCAETGVEKWIVSLEAMTCTYFSHSGEPLLVEMIPG